MDEHQSQQKESHVLRGQLADIVKRLRANSYKVPYRLNSVPSVLVAYKFGDITFEKACELLQISPDK